MPVVTIAPLNVGDTFRVSVDPPPEIDDESWISASINLMGPRGANPVNSIDGMAEVGSRGVTGTVADTSGAFQGIWGWILKVQSDTYTATAASGVVEIRDLANPVELTHEEKLVPILESLIEEKLSGRGDVIQYSIGDRSISAESVKAMRQELARVREVLKFRQGRHRRSVV